jgi:hypothetical protein
VSWVWQPLPAAQGSSGTSTYTYVGSGGAVSGGTAAVSKTKAYTPSGGGVSGGTAATSFVGLATYVYTGTGGAVTGGTAAVSKTKVFTPSGGAVTDGSAVLSKTKAYLPSGGADSGGTADTTFVSAGTEVYTYLATGGAETGGTAFYEFLAAALGVEQPSGGWGWHNLAELSRLSRKRIKREEEEDAIEAALEAAGVYLPPTVTDAPAHDLERLKGLVKRSTAIVSSHKAERAIDYAKKAQTKLAYELAVREIARELEDEEHAVLFALALL